LKEVACALAYLHQFDPPIVHRDIKPENILLTQQGSVKLVDFGTSRLLPEKYSHQTMTFGGTHIYSSPEVILEEHYAKKSDVYSYGIILWEVYTQSDPFPECTSLYQVMSAITSGVRPPIPPTCDPNFASLMRSCWADTPEERPEFDEIVKHFEQWEFTESARLFNTSYIEDGSGKQLSLGSLVLTKEK